MSRVVGSHSELLGSSRLVTVWVGVDELTVRTDLRPLGERTVSVGCPFRGLGRSQLG